MVKRGLDQKKDLNSNSQGNLYSDRSFQILKLLVEELKEKYNLNYDQILDLVKEKEDVSEILIPVSVFIKELSGLEAICKYLKENLSLNYSRIASLLNRDQRTIWISYRNAVKKYSEVLTIKETRYLIPVSLFKNRRFSIMEILVSYLKDNFSLSFKEIASILQRDQRNIWTTYSRYKKKK